MHSALFLIFFLTLKPTPTFTLFPYTTLFRSTFREDWRLVNASSSTINVSGSSTIWVQIQVTAALTDGGSEENESELQTLRELVYGVHPKTRTLKNSGTTTWSSSSSLQYVSVN